MSDVATAHSESVQPVEIVVYGKPETAGSKSSYVPLDPTTKQPYRRNGRIIVNTTDANPKSKGWKATVSASAGMQYTGPVLRGPLAVEFIFYRTRNKGDFGTGRNAGIVKDSAPAYPTKKPDVLKLARAVEDALTGIVWHDDAEIVDEHIAKRFGDEPRVEIRVYEIAERSVLDLVSAGQLEPPKPAQRFEQLSLVA